MKITSACHLLFYVLVPAALAHAAQPSPSHANNRPLPKPHNSTPASTRTLAPVTGKPQAPTLAPSAAAVPAPAPAPAKPSTAKSAVTLDAYITALTSHAALSKDEQAEIKTAYLDDGAKLHGILNDGALSPLEQTRQVDQLRDTRNDKIEALLKDSDRRQKFLQVEADYRVALIVLAANGGFVSSTPAPAPPAEKPAATS